MTTPISSATSQFIMHNQHAFRHNTIRSTLVHCNITVRSILCRRDTRRRLPVRERNTMTRKRRRIRLRTSHIPITVLYILQLLSASPRTRISPGGDSSGHRQPAQLVTIRYLNMVTNLHIAVEACWAQTEPGLLWAIPIRIPAA